MSLSAGDPSIQHTRIEDLLALVAGCIFMALSVTFYRHGASLGGIGVMALYLQKKKGWRAGLVQMGCDALILISGVAVVPMQALVLSVLSALALNLVIAMNHRRGRYFGF